MNQDRTLARTAGILYLVTFATSIPALALKTPLLQEGAQPELATWGALLEILLAFACVGTAITLLPITRRHNEPLAVGFVVSRTLEASLILVGVLCVMALASLHGSSADAALRALHGWTFLLGPAVMASVNALLLGTVLLRARLVPPLIPAIGLIDAPILLASSIGVLFGAWTQTSPIGAASALPIAVWELSLGVWLTVKGVRAAETAPARVAVRVG
ncbi:DUF4386 domain-containing protein [Microbacterium candidum]|uniref:DUF4386 domain-containing protein n=1 Tax=Microbacterium candidum TaxID=3041922 RepID=A0ABT7MUV2_9MICO|nr:DUF4386 domain-containing protein [Microbacterium sp. ASV49]MDL9978236.1 DUF4386 domain-containing protein [Microbacterium sp. ASV49]